VTLIVLAGAAFLLIRRDVSLPPGSGTTRRYPLHSFVFGDGFPHVVDLSIGLVLLAFGVWLVPRTIGAHSALAERNSELVGRVLRLTATRVDAIRALALDCPVATTADIDLPGRAPEPVEAAAYFAVAEVLANATKHADARSVHITARHAFGRLRI
jgi:hypothetical protein